MVGAAHDIDSKWYRSLSDWWSAKSLIGQFMLLSSLLVFAGLGILGYWVSNKIEQGIELDIANRSALYMENFLSPHLQDLAKNAELSQNSISKLETALARDQKSLNVAEVKIWNLQGKVIFGSNKAIIGKSFPITGELTGAAAGRIAIDFDEAPHVGQDIENAHITNTLFEIYVPIRDSETQKIIAIGEFYQDAAVVKSALNWARLESWGVTGLVSLGLIAGLYNVVARGSRLIDSHRESLDQRIRELTALLKQNEVLQERVQSATQRSNEDLEVQLRRVGADLHDGIGQILTIVLLRLDSLFPKTRKPSADHVAIKTMLNDAMTEIRDMSVGLALPEIESLSLVDAIELVASRHANRTLTKVTTRLEPSPVEPGHPVKLCLCRFVQEALNNSFKHAGGAHQRVTMDWSNQTVKLSVSDSGPGISIKKIKPKRPSLGLVGLRNRLESLGGQLSIDSIEGKGTTLTATLKVT